MNHVGIPIHPDDAACVSAIYPVPSLAQAPPGKIPLINLTGKITGRMIDQAKRGVYFVNVLAYNHGPAQNVLTPGPAVIGSVAGFSRLTETDVIGRIDTSSTALGSGIFVIEGVPATVGGALPGALPTSTGLPYDLVIEPVESSGLGAPAFGEWVTEPWMNPVPNNTPAGPTAQQTALICNDTVGGLNSVSNFLMAPGTIIELDNILHNGTVGLTLQSRPLAEIYPRVVAPAPGGQVLLRATGNFPINVPQCFLTINGVPQVLPPPTLTVGNTVADWVFTMPAGAGPRLLRFTVRETPAPGVASVRGVNEVQY